MRECQDRDQRVLRVETIFFVFEIDDFELGFAPGFYVDPIKNIGAGIGQGCICYRQAVFPQPAVTMSTLAV
ncbi:hypothetical protein D3C76_1794530 [compost metagenome]